VLDTCTSVDLDLLDPADLPAVPDVTAISAAELQQRLDLMIAATASSRNLPIYTRSAADFAGMSSMVTVTGLQLMPRRRWCDGAGTPPAHRGG